jgi:small-conductance mechanosensitive channel
MLTAVLTFLGGVAGRMVLGHLLEALTKWQDAKNEIARLKVQGEIDAAQHDRLMTSMRLQSELGVKLIEAKTEAHVTQAEADAFVEAVKATSVRSGVWWADAWNTVIRPLLATVCIGLWVSSLIQRGFVLDDWDRSLMSLALGVFVGGRVQLKGG